MTRKAHSAESQGPQCFRASNTMRRKHTHGLLIAQSEGAGDDSSGGSLQSMNGRTKWASTRDVVDGPGILQVPWLGVQVPSHDLTRTNKAGARPIQQRAATDGSLQDMLRACDGLSAGR
ncbi:hypothetical protein SUNI508_03846 [Seiridium unicorne]|uniref:Uncharacterized protein n=1 Tax=Seiridium unicorne TaxID=138068 RepID=A0ABR2VA97_9PEZI